MTKIYEEKGFPVKWCLQRIFKDTDINFISTEYSKPVYYDEPALYYGTAENTNINTIEEHADIPFNLFQIMDFVQKEKERLEEGYLLKPLSVEVYERLRKDYPHRQKDLWEREIDYKSVIVESDESLLKQFKKILPTEFSEYDEWAKKIENFLNEGQFDKAIFLLNHLFMGTTEDDSQKLDKQLENRYKAEFNINDEAAFFNVLLVDDFYFLHIYQFSLIERYSAGYDENGQICPIMHFDFECTPERAKEKLKQKNYDLILLDIDFGQQKGKAWDVAKDALKMRIPVVMFSKFELADKYAPFFGKSISRINKDLGYKEMFKEIFDILKEIYNIEEYDYNNWKIIKSSRLRRIGYFYNNQFAGKNEEEIIDTIIGRMDKKGEDFASLFIPLPNGNEKLWEFIFFGKKPYFADGVIKYLEPIQRRMKTYGLDIKDNKSETNYEGKEIEKLLISIESASEEVVFPKASKVYDWEKRDKDKAVYNFIGIDMDLGFVLTPSFSKTSLFDIMGPVMIGPSSSHTAGPNRIARLVRNFAQALKKDAGIVIKKIKVEMLNSFSFTGKGHGSDYAIAAGLLGKMQYDKDLPNSIKSRTRDEKGKEEIKEPMKIDGEEIAVQFSWITEVDPSVHENSVRFCLYKEDEEKPTYILTARSYGGGNVQITSIKDSEGNSPAEISSEKPIPIDFTGLADDEHKNDPINSNRTFLCGKVPIKLNLLTGETIEIQSIYSPEGDIPENPAEKDMETMAKKSIVRPDFLTLDDLLYTKDGKELWRVAIDYEKWVRLEESKNETIREDFIWKIIKKYRKIMLDAIEIGIDPSKESHTDYKFFYGLKEKVNALQTDQWESQLTTRAKTYAVAVNEVNAKMNATIVAAPTAGSCGVIPGVLKAMEEYLSEKGIEKEVIEQCSLEGLLTAALVGLVINNLVPTAGARAGCQAEMGTAAAMAAAMAVCMLGGSIEEVIHGAALALKNSLGLVCDPVNGKVEIPCIKRAGLKALEAMGAAFSAIHGIRSEISPWDVVGAMKQIGDDMDIIYRETSKGGLALTRFARERVIC